MNQSMHEDISPAVCILLRPEVVQFVDFKGLPSLREVCKYFRDAIDTSPHKLGYWRAVCNSYCYYAGIYSPICSDAFNRTDHKRYFFTTIFTIRDKWATGAQEQQHYAQEYKIKVDSRFRPGQLQNDKVCLPLHQFLKVKRHQRAQAAASSEQAVVCKNDAFVGEQDPDEFVDPLLGTLMKDPVLLMSSDRIVDRSVAVQCILRGGRDPFTNNRLTMHMLVPQPELAQRIQEFKVKKQQRDVSLGLNELKPLVEEGGAAVDTDLLEALMEVERMHQAVRRAQAEAAKPIGESAGAGLAEGEEGQGPEVDAEGEPAAEGPAPEGGGVGEGAAAQAQAVEHPDFTHLLATDVESHYNPISRKSERAGIVEINSETSTVCMHVPGAGVRPFHYTAVHKGEASQQSVYEKSAQEAVTAALNGFNSCLMCYGQTGSGKTYTFFGPEEAVFSGDERLQQKQGVVLRACQELLDARDRMAVAGIAVVLSAQFVELYEEQVTCLFSGQAASIRRDTGQVVGAVEVPLTCMEQVVEALRAGHDRKKFAATQMNERSSRSHTALIVHVAQKLSVSSFSPSALQDITGRCQSLRDCAAAGGDLLLHSQLHLVDLAGSERVKKSRVEGQRLREAVGINSSLLVLGKVIAALVQGKSHVPYLESKLTTLLKAAFGGNSRTTVLVNCRMDGESGEETLQSMRFGERCAMVSNSMRLAASSYQSALTAVDSALDTVRAQLGSLEQRGKQHLPSYKALLQSYQHLDRKRAELVAVHGAKSAAAGTSESTVLSGN